MTQRLLLVEQSATMRYLMDQHIESLGFAVDAFESFAQATESLTKQFQQFGAEYSGVVFGWPIATHDEATAFAQYLETSEAKDLPVVVMSTDMRAEARAWVGGRDLTQLLPWKEYQGLQERLNKLVDTLPENTLLGRDGGAQLNNADIHLLVVDESVTIRHSMRDLFQMQGYRVTLARTPDEAMTHASATRVDIAVLDYYLSETTGDLLCRDLLASQSTGNIQCTIMTGTYSDHIIKRSLRAGAVECMFKNESSELLLSRIATISRSIRQRRELLREQQLLDEMLQVIAGAVVLINKDRNIVYVNPPAVDELGIADKFVLIGQPAATLLEQGGPAEPGKDIHTATWKLQRAADLTLEVDYQHIPMEHSGYSLLRFARRSVPLHGTDMPRLQRSTDLLNVAQRVVKQFSLNMHSELFFEQMQRYLDADIGEQRTSFLVLDVFTRRGEAELIPVSEHPAVAESVHESLSCFLSDDNHVVRLSGYRYGFLLRHADDARAYVLTRKIMQQCLELSFDVALTDQYVLACRASLLSLTRNASQPMSAVVQHAFNGMDIVNTKDSDQALLLDVKRFLSAYPKSESPKNV